MADDGADEAFGGTTGAGGATAFSGRDWRCAGCCFTFGRCILAPDAFAFCAEVFARGWAAGLTAADLLVFPSSYRRRFCRCGADWMDWALQVAAFSRRKHPEQISSLSQALRRLPLPLSQSFFDAPDALMDVGFTAFCEVLLPAFWQFGSMSFEFFRYQSIISVCLNCPGGGIGRRTSFRY